MYALRDVSFEVARGEFFGIVGKNGSGKSTLLRCLAAIYPVDTGTVDVQGRLVPFIELGLGFSPELAARDNAITNAVLLGLSRREAAARFDEMLAFAGLEDFAELKLKNYSSGMAVRLAFAVTVHVDADVLLFDEVLAVGDGSFRKKCVRRFEQLRDEGKTVILVTHDMEMVRGVCSRALMLHRGEVVDIGEPDAIAEQYDKLSDGDDRVAPRRAPDASAAPRPPTRRNPALLGPQPRRFGSLVGALALTEFKLKYSGTAMNLLWAVARPLAQFGALLLVFTALRRFTDTIPHYAAWLLLGIVLWTFFNQVTAGAVSSLSDRSELLRKLPFPHLAVPLASVATGLVDLAINLMVAFVFILGSGVTPRLAWLELPLLIALLGVLTTGVGLALSAFYVRFRDVDQVWQVLSQTIFWLSPIFYVATFLPLGYAKALVLANPIAALLTEARYAIVDPDAPTAASVAGGWVFLLVPLGIVFGSLALGLVLFSRASPRAAENV